ncbi:unnamed protein product [Durusdinium trenchii]|uniref:Uncharacterized protein n=2 Tax=Durusdinium trenchii TaxID=1381693 RepID=A0ABP0NXJ8_9DINO
MAPLAAKSTLYVNWKKDVLHLLQDDKWEAKYELISIIPKISTESYVDLVQGRFGPFRAHVPMKLPLWAALEMEEHQMCSIELPPWMEEDQLKALCTEEKANRNGFTPLPRHYMEIAFALLPLPKVFGGKEKYRQRIVLLLRELIELRRSKILEGIKLFDSSGGEFNVTNMSAAELSCFRTRSLCFLDSLSDLLRNRQLEVSADVEMPVAEPMDEDSSSRPF